MPTIRPFIFSIAVVLLGFGTANAGDLYKWQDEDGIWHFQDRPPGEGTTAEVSVLERDPTSPISMQRLGTRQQPAYEFFNGLHGPVELRVWLASASNVATKPPLPLSVVLEGQQRRRLVSFSAVDPGKVYSFSLAHDWTPGLPMTQLPDSDVLPLPVPAGRSYLVSQGSGTTTHLDDANLHAMDLGVPEGTPVLAVMDGTVMEAEDGYQGGGTDLERYIYRANRVILFHDDGRMTTYAHLQPGSVQVRSGNRVRKGDFIARSGNTGFSTGPHLHFSWQQNMGGRLMSLPFRVRQPDGSAVIPREQMQIEGTLGEN